MSPRMPMSKVSISKSKRGRRPIKVPRVTKRAPDNLCVLHLFPGSSHCASVHRGTSLSQFVLQRILPNRSILILKIGPSARTVLDPGRWPTIASQSRCSHGPCAVGPEQEGLSAQVRSAHITAIPTRDRFFISK